MSISNPTNESKEMYDVVVIGAGIVGLATGRELLIRRPSLRLLLVDKEHVVAAHQTGHNSGVLHAGLYYQPGTLKARLCRTGHAAMVRYSELRGINIHRCGKLVVASCREELTPLKELAIRAEANEVPGLEMVGPAGLRDIEPHAVGVGALRSPFTSIIDYKAVATAMAVDIENAGGTIRLGVEVTGISRRRRTLVLGETVMTRHAIACGGLQADRLERMSGAEMPERIVPFRGDYYTLSDSAAELVSGLIYPVPDPRFPFLGIHLTRTIDGRVLAGPNAVLAMKREGYRRRDVKLGDAWSVVADPGFRRLARRYWRTGLSEMWRDMSKRAFLQSVQKFVPEVMSEDLAWGPSGVRAQAIDPDGTLVDDFRLGGDARLLHVRNAPSPAATASMAIASHLADQADKQFVDLV